MRHALAKMIPLAIVMSTLFVARAPHAATAQQRDDGLDQPLTAANMCGAGGADETHFTIAATGDTFPHENIQAVGEAQGYDYLFDHVRPFLQAADLAYTNFDGAMLESSERSGYPNFNYSPKLATALKKAGIGLVSTANNHIMDRGPEGLDATLGVLAQNSIQQHGTVTSTASLHPPYLPITLSRDGKSIKLGFLSFSWGTNGIPDPNSQVNLLWQSSEYGQQGGIRQSVLDAVAQARRETDAVIVAAHWGYEYQFYPDAAQIEGAKQLAAAGADVILGAQPHTLQPVDVIDTNGRKTLVIYSLANFIASQGAFQTESYSATSVIFYVGLVREGDGRVRATGYRYLPTIHVDDDTRPAPLTNNDAVLAHVRAELRDPGGAKQISADPATLGGRVEVCPTLTLPGDVPQRIGGDFATFYTTLGGGVVRPLDDAVAVLGAPLGPSTSAKTADCGRTIAVLATEQQRLELDSVAAWPARVQGTQVGTAVYEQKYNLRDVPRRTNLDGDAIANQRFQQFFQTYGGLAVFGYPISAALTEAGADGTPTTVQYFERARLELAPDVSASAPLRDQVRLGALGRAYAAIYAARCDPAAQANADAAPSAAAASALLPAAMLTAAQSDARGWWIYPVLLLLFLLGFVGWREYQRWAADYAARDEQRRTARSRSAARHAQPRAAPPQSDEDVLRELLDL